MKRYSIRRFAAFAIVPLVAFAFVMQSSDAFAGHRHHHHHYGGGDLLAAGVVGAFVGALVAQPPAYAYPEPVYVYPQPVYPYPYRVYADPQPYYGYDSEPYQRRSLHDINRRHSYQPPEPRFPGKSPRVVTYEDTVDNANSGGAWTPEWYAYCRERFRSFDPGTGTYLGYDNQRHFCTMR